MLSLAIHSRKYLWLARSFKSRYRLTKRAQRGRRARPLKTGIMGEVVSFLIFLIEARRRPPAMTLMIPKLSFREVLSNMESPYRQLVPIK